MSKKFFLNPFVLALSDQGDDIYDGGDTSHYTTDDPTDIYPVSFATWYGWHQDDDPTQEDYYNWWVECGFDQETWESLNGDDVPWPGGN